jgi:DNA-binding transcriptional MerR regulator
VAARSAAARAGSAAPDLLTIGQVLARLKPEFPDLSSSKLRFLEERELVTPIRTASGYRKFSAADLERLRVILGLQRDHYLPLKVIKEYLADADTSMQEASSLTTLGSKPLIVVTADEGITDSQWQSKQDHMATLSTNSLHRHANATHQSLLGEEADSAAASQAIRDVVEAVRTSRPLT